MHELHELHELHEHVNFTQMISNHLKSRHVWKCQNIFTWTSHDISKFSKRCLQRTDAARCREVPRGAARCREVPRCKFQSEIFEAVKAFERKKTYFHRTDDHMMHPEVGVYCKWKIGTKMIHIQMMLKCQLIELFVFYSSSFELCAFTWYNCT